MSFEKWLIDGELRCMLRKTIAARDIAVDSIDVDTIKSVGSDGNHLVYPANHKHCCSLYHPNLFARDDYESRWNSGDRSVSEFAAETLPKRLAESTEPSIDAGIGRTHQLSQKAILR
jgi:trimethylamine:corrinoid methyltransferase-like protein